MPWAATSRATRITERRVRSAGEIGLGAADRREHAIGHREVLRLARVRGAGERQGVGAEAEPVEDTVFDEGQRLERLGGGAPESDQRGVARHGDRPPIRVGHDGAHPMDRLHRGAADRFHPEIAHWA